MANGHIEINYEGVGQLLKGPEMQQFCLAQAQAIAGRAGSGYSADVRAGRRRAVARVSAVTEEAQKDNQKNNTLLKAVN